MNTVMRLLILLAAFYATEISAQEIFSCEARSVDVNTENLKSQSYEKFYPTIIINADNNSVSYVYTQHGMQFKSYYRIEAQTEDLLVGIEKWKPDYVSIIHIDKVSKKFNSFVSGTTMNYFGNTVTAGKCFN